MLPNFLDNIPFWLLYILTFLFGFLAFEVGFRYGIFHHKKASPESDKSLDAMTGATLGMLAFLLAFVMSISIDRHDSRRQFVVDEATAIHSAYLQAGYLNEPYSSQIRSLLTEYIGLRIATVEDATVEQNINRSEAIQAEVWKLAETMVKENPGRDEVSLFLESLGEVINLHTRRVTAAFTARLPVSILYGMYLVAALSMVMVGMQNSASGERNLFITIALLFVFTIVFMLIIDLDRPQEGFLRVSQQALIDVQRLMSTSLP